MRFALTAEQLESQRLAADFAQREVAPRVREYDRDGYLPRDLVRRLGELGFTGGIVPEAYGGSSLDHLAFALILEAIARADWTLAGIASYPSGITGVGLLRYGAEEQKRRYLVPLARGERLASIGVTEPQSGTNVAGMQTVCRRDGDSYVISGRKLWITGACDADFVVTFASLDRGDTPGTTCAFLIDRGTPGFTTREIPNRWAARAGSIGELLFENCRVPADALLGEPGNGYRVAIVATEHQRLWVAARACGMIQACLDASLAYARERIVFGQPIGRYQLIQSKLADQVVGLETARLLVYRLAWLKDQGVERTRQASSIAKLYSSDVLLRSAIDTCQIHGAYSCSDEYPVGRYFRDAKVFQIIEGTNELHRLLVAEYTLGYRKS